jgi:integrase/recombinase XerD
MNTLHAVSPVEAEQVALRAEALRWFKGRYRHKSESQRTMVEALRRVAVTATAGQHDETTFPWDVIIDEDLAGQICGKVADVYAHATLVKSASALRVMLDCCRKVGLIDHDAYVRARGFEAKGGYVPSAPGTYLSEDDVAAMVRACHSGGNPNTQIRDAAIVLSLVSSGARGDELAHVRSENVHLQERRIWLHHTKSGQPRDAWLHPAAVTALERWMSVRGTAGRDLFVPLSRTGRPLIERGSMSTQQVRKVVKQRAARAGLGDVNPHDCRRFVVSTLLDNFDIALVAKTVGHKNPTTTAAYDKRPAQRQRDAVAQIPLPTVGPVGPPGGERGRVCAMSPPEDLLGGSTPQHTY